MNQPRSTEFSFDKKAINRVVEGLDAAEEYIKIAVFQLHREDIFNVLMEKVSAGVDVEIITLPYDSINEAFAADVEKRFENLRKEGAKIHFLRWNVGDPNRTSTAVGRWYAYHGKFIVTEKIAIILSANLIESTELDAVLTIVDTNKIEEFKRKFEKIYKRFIYNKGGTLRREIQDAVGVNAKDLLSLPAVIESDTHKDFWIRHYPTEIFEKRPDDLPDALYITPFEYTARNLYEKVIEEAKKHVYISAESFTDEAFSRFLIGRRLEGIDVKILSSMESMDFRDRVNRMVKDMLASGIYYRVTEEDLHAKLLITDKTVVIGSVNLNKMNLGFHKGSGYWRANTEVVYVASDSVILEKASESFLDVFNKSLSAEIGLSEKIERDIGKVFNKVFKLSSRKEVKILFARLLTTKEIEVKALMYKIGQYASNIVRLKDKKTVGREDFLQAVILYHLSERKHDLEDLKAKVFLIDDKMDTKSLIRWLVEKEFIEKDGEYYKVKVERILTT